MPKPEANGHCIAADVDRLTSEAGLPVTEPLVPETMQAYYDRLKKKLDTSHFKVVDAIDTDGLYIGKRAIRGAQGQGDLLNQAGTVFYHTVLYIHSSGKTRALDFGPQGSADVTANVMEAVPCGAVLHEEAVPDQGNPLVHIQLPFHDLEDDLLKKAIRFAESRKYHAINNNCIHNTDFFCRVLTGGRVRNAPMLYDLLAGKVPEQDHPMLLMFFLMTRLSWFHVCDGSKLTAAFLASEGIQSPQTAAVMQPDVKPPAQNRLEEQQIDLMKLVQSLQQGSSPSPGPKFS